MLGAAFGDTRHVDTWTRELAATIHQDFIQLFMYKLGLNYTTVQCNVQCAMCILFDYGNDALDRVCVVFVNLLTPAPDQ